MKENYSEVLESYLIPTEEGFIGTTLKVFGYTIKALIAFPIVIIGGVLFVSGIDCAREARKLRKTIKNNKGNYVNYGSASYKILRCYSKDIIGVEEPLNFSKVLNQFQIAEKFTKELDSIRDEFRKIINNDPSDTEKCKLILNKLKNLKSRVTKICNSEIIDKLFEKSEKSNLNKCKLDQSNILKLTIIESRIYDILWRDSYNHEESEILFGSLDGNDASYDEKWDIMMDNSIADECGTEFGDIVSIIEKFTDSTKFIELCKFAVNPKLKQSKK